MRTPRVNFSSSLLHPKLPVCRLALWGALGLPGLLARGADDARPQSTVIVRSAPVVAPDELALGVRSAVKMALAKNTSIRVERYDIPIAHAHVTQAVGVFDPVLTVHGQVSENDNPGLIHERKGQIDVTNLRSVDEPFSASVRTLTPLGGVVSVGTSTDSFFNKTSNPRQTYRSSVGVSLSQPLMNGFGVDATMAPIRLARRDEQISRWEFRETVIGVVTDTIQTYASLYFARASLAVAERSRDLAQKLLDERQRQVKSGSLTALDVSVARSQLAIRQETIITARETAREAENALKLCVSDDIERLLLIHLNIAPPEEREPGALNFELDLPHAYACRPDYQQMLLDLQERQITLVFDRNSARPQLDLSASLGSTGLNQNLGASLAQTYHGDYLGASAGLTLQLPIVNRTGKARVTAAQLSAAQGLIALKQLEQQIVIQLDNALGQVRAGRASIGAAEEALRLARESLDAEEKKLALGASSTYAVLQMQDQLSSAENDLLRAHTTYQKALATYDQQAGRTLERNNVELAE